MKRLKTLLRLEKPIDDMTPHYTKHGEEIIDVEEVDESS